MKKFGMIVLAVVLCTVLLAGCAVPVPVPVAAETQTPSASPNPSESASASPSPSVSAEPSAQESLAAGETDYMSWTGEDWSAATDEEKLEAAMVLLGKAGDKLVGEGFTKLMELAQSDESAKAEIEEGAKALITSIDEFFEMMPSATLSQLVEVMEAAVNNQQE